MDNPTLCDPQASDNAQGDRSEDLADLISALWRNGQQMLIRGAPETPRISAEDTAATLVIPNACLAAQQVFRHWRP